MSLQIPVRYGEDGQRRPAGSVCRIASGRMEETDGRDDTRM